MQLKVQMHSRRRRVETVLTNIAAAISATKSINVFKSRKHRVETVSKSTSQILIILLIIAGDVNLNPGPSEHSPNRYKLLENIVERLSPKKKKSKGLNLNVNEDEINLLDELMSITPKDYVGIDKCRSCYKEVKDNQPAIECDECENWIHVRCSDMKRKTYNENKMKKTFKCMDM